MMAVSGCVGVRNRTQDLGKSNLTTEPPLQPPNRFFCVFIFTFVSCAPLRPSSSLSLQLSLQLSCMLFLPPVSETLYFTMAHAAFDFFGEALSRGFAGCVITVPCRFITC